MVTAPEPFLLPVAVYLLRRDVVFASVEGDQMITILFVHGTGVRVDGYKTTLDILQERLCAPDLQDLRIEGCPWGDQCGSRRAEKSVFRYKETGATIYTAEDAQSDMWRLLAHSLGGVACVDLLLDPANQDLKGRVKLLITVGSQAPYFYEINALSSLPYQEDQVKVDAAFAQFPRWVNLHNRRDFLSYIGEAVFPNRVQDLEVHSRLPFPQSHTSYFTRTETYDHIWNTLRDCFKRPKCDQT